MRGNYLEVGLADAREPQFPVDTDIAETEVLARRHDDFTSGSRYVCSVAPITSEMP